MPSPLRSSITYRQTNYDSTVDCFVKPAPAKPYNFNFSTFKGNDHPGDWKLYIIDNKGRAAGSLGA